MMTMNHTNVDYVVCCVPLYLLAACAKHVSFGRRICVLEAKLTKIGCIFQLLNVHAGVEVVEDPEESKKERKAYKAQSTNSFVQAGCSLSTLPIFGFFELG
jgi:hypothetical protein